MSSKPTLSSAKHVADKKISKFALLKPRMKPVPRAVPVAKKGAKPQMAGSGKGGAVILRPAGQKPSGAKGQAKGTGKPDKGAGKSWNNSSQQSWGKGGEKGKQGKNDKGWNDRAPTSKGKGSPAAKGKGKGKGKGPGEGGVIRAELMTGGGWCTYASANFERLVLG